MSKAKLVIDGIIGEADPMLTAFGVPDTTISSQYVAKFLEDNAEADTIEVEIRSNGGSVSHGFDIYDQLVNSGKTIITKGYRVNSIATVIFLAGSKRLLSKNAEFIIHNPRLSGDALNGMVLTADALEQLTIEMQQSEDKMFNFYATKLKLNDSEKVKLSELMSVDSDLGADEAIRFGFATGYLESNSNKSKASIAEMIMAYNKQKSNKNSNMDSVKVEEKITGLEKSVAKILALFTTKKKAEVVADITPLADGVNLYHEGELEVGSAVFTDEAMTVPAPDGDHKLLDGNVISVAGGIVTAIVVVQPDDEVQALKDKVAELEGKLADVEAEKKVAVDANVEAEKAVKLISDELTAVKKIVIGSKADDKKKAVVVSDENIPDWKKKLNRIRENRVK